MTYFLLQCADDLADFLRIPVSDPGFGILDSTLRTLLDLGPAVRADDMMAGTREYFSLCWLQADWTLKRVFLLSAFFSQKVEKSNLLK